MPRNRRKIDKSDLPKLNSTQLSLQSFRKWSTNQRCLLNVSATVNCLLAIGPLFLNSKTSLLTDVPFLTSYLLLSTNTFSLVAILNICDQLIAEDFVLENAESTIFTRFSYLLKAAFYGYVLLNISTIFTFVKEFITSN